MRRRPALWASDRPGCSCRDIAPLLCARPPCRPPSTCAHCVPPSHLGPRTHHPGTRTRRPSALVGRSVACRRPRGRLARALTGRPDGVWLAVTSQPADSPASTLQGETKYGGRPPRLAVPCDGCPRAATRPLASRSERKKRRAQPHRTSPVGRARLGLPQPSFPLVFLEGQREKRRGSSLEDTAGHVAGGDRSLHLDVDRSY